jgi:hypothetical protein
MAGKRRKKIEVHEPTQSLRGSRLLKPINHLIEKLNSVGTERDHAGNRKLFFDHYATLLLLYFFTPSLGSLRALQGATEWEKTREKLGTERTSLGSLSEAANIFDAAHLEPIIHELAAQAAPRATGREAEAPKGLTAVDGSIFAGMSRMAWALWNGPENRAAKLHLPFDVLKGVPCQAAVTPAACSEPGQLEVMLQPGRLDVVDRGYADYELFAKIVAAGSSLVARVKDGAAFTVEEERPLAAAAARAGVIRDVIPSRLGTSHHKDHLRRPMRLVVVRTVDRDGKANELRLITDRLGLDADLVALAYRYRWTAELSFRWLKCILGARHLISQSRNGVTLPMYAALIVSLLIVLRAGRKPTKRTYEMIRFDLVGWVSDEEFETHLSKLEKASKKAG